MIKKFETVVDQRLLEHFDQLVAFLRDRSRSSRIGSLLGGIVHNLNGSVQILSMQLEMIQKILSGRGSKIHPSLQEKVDQCMAQMDKLRSMLDGLSPRERDEERKGLEKIHLNEVLEREIELFRHHLFFKHHVNVKKNLSSRLPLCHGHEADFGEALANLIENAVEAMEETSQKHLTLTTRAGHDHLQVVIADTGCGLPTELRPQLFTPFFTTKNGNHYGLGLFMSRHLLTSYGAKIEAHFKEGETLFSVKIPLTHPHALPKKA